MTQRGQPVALLTPLPNGAGMLDRLIATGLAHPATRDLLDVQPLPNPGRNIEEIIDAFLRALGGG